MSVDDACRIDLSELTLAPLDVTMDDMEHARNLQNKGREVSAKGRRLLLDSRQTGSTSMLVLGLWVEDPPGRECGYPSARMVLATVFT